jgi:hypothetical protein
MKASILCTLTFPENDDIVSSRPIEIAILHHYQGLYTILVENTTEIPLSSVSIDPDLMLIQIRHSKQDIPHGTFRCNDFSRMLRFQTCFEECLRISDIWKNVESRLRDAYYAGFYEQNNIPDCDDSISAILQLIQLKDLVNVQELIRSTINSGSRLSQVNENSEKLGVASCFYCGEKQGTEILYSHPYVPRSYKSESIIICGHCVENWHSYREAAIYDNELILPNETNEEICSLCSDSPETLILCSFCPRSFCEDCLKKIDEDHLKSIHNNNEENWTCMSCFNRIPSNLPLSRDSWKVTASSETSVHSKQPNPCSSRKVTHRLVNNSKFDRKQSPGAKRSDSNPPSVKDGAAEPLNRFAKPKESLGIERPQNATLNNNGELYYFSQYVDYLSYFYDQFKVIKKQSNISRSEIPTDDVCFLCKDGGNVIECDWSGPRKYCCRKVYHEYCLNFEVKADIQWCCPRHFCSCCGSQSIKYMCMFCPISICNSCPKSFAMKVSSLSSISYQFLTFLSLSLLVR